ncbi:MAG TPA: cytochrome c [Gemmatimonadales bacterium]|nr:cytochrome c [Gemmatimonadales bacterium]
MIHVALAALSLTAAAQADSGAMLYRDWCSRCHGESGRGDSRSSVQLDVPAADLASCPVSTAEPEERWIAIVRDGGQSVGLSMDMPAFGEGATPEQLQAVVRYVKSLCGEPAWPPGELNFPRAFLTEKAFPENEVVIETRGRAQEFIYERRIGARLQVEGVLRTLADSAGGFQSATGAVKYNAWHSLARRALVSVGLEVTPALKQGSLWEVEPFVAYGLNPGGGATVIQGEVLLPWEENAGIAGGQLRLGVGQLMGRAVPMLEAGWTVPRDGEQQLTLFPQVWLQLSRLGHVAASGGVELPVAGPAARRARLVAFVLWDFGDGPLFRGW